MRINSGSIGERRTRARHPNSVSSRSQPSPDATPKLPYNVGQKTLPVLERRHQDNGELEEVDVVVLHLWVSVRLAVESIDEKLRSSTSSRREAQADRWPRCGALLRRKRLELLDTPGEWYLDRKKGRLYYWPDARREDRPDNAVAPVLPMVLKLQGKPEAKE